ncbi:MAG TPA: hypothetical protein VF322_07865 [Gammaproteobacteria bacterium]
MTDIDVQWASSRIEAMADGSLPADERRRMRAAMARDPSLRAAVERAQALNAELRRLGRVPVPGSLPGRLLALAQARGRPRRVWAWVAGAVAAAAVAASALVLLDAQRAREREAAAARQQVEVALAYLGKASEIAAEEVGRAVRTSVRAAAEASSKAIRDDEPREGNGDGA